MSPDEYNARSMSKLGWSRESLGLAEDATLSDISDAVREFQKEQGLTVDGKCGPNTWRRLQAHAEFIAHERYPDAEGFITVGGVLKPVPFKSIPCTPSSAYSLIGEGHSHRSKDPISVVWHWDAALSAESCYRILKKRGISCHGTIDNDGTLVQHLDFKDHVGWHAGHRKVNKVSLGFEISDAVYMKYQNYYEKRWGARPVWKAEVHGRTTREFLGLYESQIRACIYLSNFIYTEFGIPLVHPGSNTVIDKPEKFEGHMAHFHITKNKWDVAGFPFDRVMEEAK